MKAIAAVVSVAAALAGCATHHYPGTPEQPARIVAESEAGKPIELERGRRITLRLEANHSTGFRWLLAPMSDGALEQYAEPFYAADKSKPGVGGAEYWQFRAVRSGKAELRFEYRRPWEADKPAAKGLSYTIDVR
jgi:predicted secreted protein